MILVKVAYDSQSQQFRLLDPDLVHMFDDGEAYLVAVDIFPSDSTEWLDNDTVDVLPAGTGHA
jgi:hypothetical protein